MVYGKFEPTGIGPNAGDVATGGEAAIEAEPTPAEIVATDADTT